MLKKTNPDFSKFEAISGITFRNKELLRRAFTHRSYINENKTMKLEHNERLEFLGDAVLELSVTNFLFKKYPKVTDIAAAPLVAIEEIIKSTGFYHNKAISIKGLAASIIEHFNSEVPNSLEELITLPGVGRKTANVVLGNAFNIPGVTVDTHVGRISRRLGWTKNTDPVKVEFDIMEIFPDQEWTMLNHRLIFLGRRVCHSRKPACGACELASMCPSFGQGPRDPNEAAKLIKTGA